MSSKQKLYSEHSFTLRSMYHSSYAIHFVPSWKTKKPAANILAADFFTKEPSLWLINSIPRLKRPCHMFPIDHGVRILYQAIDQHRERQVSLPLSRRKINPAINLHSKPLLECIS